MTVFSAPQNCVEQVRRHVGKFARPGMKLLEIAEDIEMSARALV